MYSLCWRQVSSAVDFCWLLHALPRWFLIHKVTHSSYNITEVIRVFPSPAYRTALTRVYFSTPLWPASFRHCTLVFFFIPDVLTCTRTRYGIYCVSTCVHTIFQIHLWHVFFSPGSDPYFDSVDRIVFNGSLYTHRCACAQSNFGGR